jgi:HD-GYP domain-containing protein (c-di-GMP phosphodiesterase class II)
MNPDAQVDASIGVDDTRLIAQARAAVLEQNKKDTFDATPYEHATELLESLPPSKFVDSRVQLALDITVATRADYRPDLSRRALYAAFPAGGELKDLSLKRKWFTFSGIIESSWGNAERAFKYKFIALELCEQLKDLLGFCAEWNNFASLANGSGLYRDAERYATVAIDSAGDSDVGWLHVRSMALLVRANALMRLGQFAEAESDILLSLTAMTHPTNAAVKNAIFFAQYVFAEVKLDQGDVPAARAALLAAATWAEACDIPKYTLQIERVRARLSALERGGLEQAVSKLKDLLERAHAWEAKFGESTDEDVVLDVLHTLERVHREHGDLVGADEWLEAIGRKLRNNAAKMLDALKDKPLLGDGTAIAAKSEEIDKYLESRATSRPGTFGGMDASWTYVIGLAASAIGAEDLTKEHGVRVARLASLVARELDLSDTLRRGIEAGCLVHDVGKISVPAPILMKRTALDPSELRLYYAHPHVGAELIERLKHPEQSVVRNVVRFHHQPYFGDTHVHTAYSSDAVFAGTREDPRGAYRFSASSAFLASASCANRVRSTFG